MWDSPDLINWRMRGMAFQRTPTTWGRSTFWAPEVIKHQNVYYMIYSAAGGNDGYKRICIARSVSPTGPFLEHAAPLFDNGKGYIDGHIFRDTNGQLFLYCVRDLSDPPSNESSIYVAPLKQNLTGLDGPLTQCISPSQPWEGGAQKWNEAPFVIRHNGYYYMLYSGNVFASSGYSIGYATAVSPTGPWTKFAGNPIVSQTADISGPGHCSVIASPDGTELWMAYHTHQQWSGGGPRQLALDRIHFEPQSSGPDLLQVPGGPSVIMQDVPSGAPSFPAGGSDEFNGSELDRDRWIVFNEEPNRYNISGGELTISTRVGDTYEALRADQANIFLQYPPWESFEITTRMEFKPGQNFEQASLFVWQDHNNYIRFSNAWINGRRFEIGTETNASFDSQIINRPIPDHCWMRLRKDGNTYSFFTSSNGIQWEEIGQERTVSFIDIKAGFGASAPESGRTIPARFDYFHIEPVGSRVADWTLY